MVLFTNLSNFSFPNTILGGETFASLHPIMLTSTINLYKKSFAGLSREIWLLSAVTLINRIGMMVMPFLALYTTKELGFTITQAGVIGGFFGFGSLAGSWVGGKLTAKFGEFRVQFWSLFLSGFAYFLLLAIREYYAFCIGIFICSFIADAFRPAMMSAVGSYAEPSKRARAMSLIRLSINLGFSGGVFIGGVLTATVGYHWLLIIEGATCIAAGIFFYFMLPNYDSEHKEMKKQMKAMNIKVRSPYRDPIFLLFVFFLLINAIAFMQLFYTFPLFCTNELDLTEDQYGILMSLNGLLLFALEMPVVFKLENHKNKLALTGWGTLLISLSFLVYNIGGWYISVAVIAIILVTVGEMISFPFSSALVLDRTNEHNRGDYMGLYASAFSLSLILSPLIGTWIADNYGFGALWWFVGGLSLFASAGLFWLGLKNKNEPNTEIPQTEEVLELV
jgi:predicted MFS family arabinose efflux permease